jgi:hypothetical protein
MARNSNFHALHEKLIDIEARYKAVLQKAQRIETEIFMRSAGQLSNNEYNHWRALYNKHLKEAKKLSKQLTTLRNRFHTTRAPVIAERKYNPKRQANDGIELPAKGKTLDAILEAFTPTARVEGASDAEVSRVMNEAFKQDKDIKPRKRRGQEYIIIP